MKAHTNDFKSNIYLHGREIDSKITYELDGEVIELGKEELNSISPHFEGNILKSVMKQIDIDSNVEIPIGTIFNYQFGIKIGDNYEYLDFGNYIVNKSEKQEASNSYSIVAYDKMLYSMKEYQSTGVIYPTTLRTFINALCNKIGLTFANANDTFANYNRTILGELYLDNEGHSMDYTYRDVLDELAQATGSTICINNNDELEIRYISDSHDTINEEYLKNINVTFGEKYGPINSIVLSRSAGADNVYIQDTQSIEQNGLCEIKIEDNQIMNWNDRSDYLPDLLSVLSGLEYYLNNFVSTGIMYYDLCDRYTVHIGENDYSCVMFNDEPLITQGLQEQIFTNRPDDSETDYTKADKTDRRINQTYLIVDKQNQSINAVISDVDGQNTKINTLTARVDSLESKISEISDITISGETQIAQMRLDNVNESEPITVLIHPINQNIDYLYPSQTLYPSDTQYMTNRILKFHNITTNEDSDYELPEGLLVYDNEHYDEFELQYGDGSPESQVCRVTKRCKYNADGSIGLLSQEEIHIYSFPEILLQDGDYLISLYGCNSGYMFVRLMTKNIYTTQFYTKIETNSLINQTAEDIDLSVDTKLSNYSTTTEMNSAISLKANEITSSVSETYATKTTTNQLSSRISQTAKSIDLSVTDNETSAGINIKLKNEDGTEIDSEDANITLSGLVSFTNLRTSGQTVINGGNIQTGTLSASKITTGTLNGNNVSITNLNASNIKTGTLNGNNVSVTNLSASNIKSGSLTSTNVKIGSWKINGTGILSDLCQIYPEVIGYRIDTAHGWASQTWYNVGRAASNVSDKKLKKKIKSLDNKYNNFFDELKPVKFEYKKSDNKTHIGFIAQDVQEAEKNNNLDLDIVYETDDYLNLDKREIIALNTWQIQLLKKEIKELKKEIEELKKGR